MGMVSLCGSRGLQHPVRGAAGFTLVEMLVVVAILSIITVVVAPKILGSREKAMAATCAAAFHMMDGELSNRVSQYESTGDPLAASKSINEVVQKAQSDGTKNPRNRSEVGYVSAGTGPVTPSSDTSCQVFLQDATPTTGTDLAPAVALWQFEQGEVRSFRITLN